jgi:hypothetical protein
MEWLKGVGPEFKPHYRKKKMKLHFNYLNRSIMQ